MNDTEALKQSVYDFTIKIVNSDDSSYVYRQAMNVVEPQIIKSVMDFNNGNQTKTADALGISRHTLRSKLIRYGLHTGWQRFLPDDE